MIISLIAAATILTCPEYNRSDYKHWIDRDNNGLNTREEIIREENILFDSTKSNEKGIWLDEYSGKYYIETSELDLDHRVGLKQAHVSGAWKWPKELKTLFANSLSNRDDLLLVHRSLNRSKGSKDPAHWLPPHNVKEYLLKWVAVKNRWGLSYDSLEYKVLKDSLGDLVNLPDPIPECIPE